MVTDYASGGRVDSAWPKVFHVSHTAQPGGAELALTRLVRAGTGWNPAVCAPANGSAFTPLAREGIPLDDSLPAMPGGGTRSNQASLAARYLVTLRAAARALRKSPLFSQADLIHANTAAAAIISAMALRGRETPLIIHLRDMIARESLGPMGHRAFIRIALPRCRGVIANSQATLDSASNVLAAGTHRIVIQSPSGVTRRATRAVLSDSVQNIGIIGRLQPWKGQHVFLRAFAAAFAGTSVRAHVAGAPLFGQEAYANELQELALRLGIGDQVVFHGHVDDVTAFLYAMDIVVHASTRPEPLGQIIVQALAAGRPIIATEGGGPSQMIAPGMNGLLVAPDRPGELSAAMQLLASDAELREKLAAGAVATPGLLTDAECAALHADFFLTLAKGRVR